MFTDKLEHIISNGVGNIGGKHFITKEVEIFIWSFIDDEGQLSTNKFYNVIYFTEYSVKILSKIELTESMKDDEVTWVLTKSKYYICAWGFGKYKEIISHSENCFL